MPPHRKLLVDCDTGSDDAIALLMAFHHDDVDVIGITAVNGNAPVDDCTRNILQVLRIVNKPEVKYITLDHTLYLHTEILSHKHNVAMPQSYGPATNKTAIEISEMFIL